MSAQLGNIDLRSDTVTRPTAAMWEKMPKAPLGDDGLDHDPSAKALEEATASLLGKDAGLYVPSATMANLIAILGTAGRGSQVIMEANSHIYTTEQGGAGLTGAFYLPIAGSRGAMDTQALKYALDHDRNALPTALICMETTHNSSGGAVLPLEHMAEVYRIASSRGIPVHLDGARLFNAAVALGVSAATIARHVDTVTVCLSKGLSAPVGAVLVGPREQIQLARAIRKTLGGSQRQVGIMASAGLEGISSMVERLAVDHATAARLSQKLNSLGSGLRAATPESNIVMVDVSNTGLDSTQWVEQLRAAGTLVRAWTPQLLRCVTHRHIDEPSVDAAVLAFAAIARASRP